MTDLVFRSRKKGAGGKPATVLSSAVLGIDAYVVEVDITRGLPAFSTVGLAETAVKEAKSIWKMASKRFNPTLYK